MNILDLLNSNNIPHKQHGEHHHTTNGWIQIDCPYCSPNSSQWRLGINIHHHGANCWVCGPKYLLHALTECGINSRDISTLEVKRLGKTELVEQKRELIYPKAVCPMAHPHKEYIRSRGLNPLEIQKLWSVSGLGMNPQWPWSVFVPIHHHGKVVSWMLRSIGEAGKRYHFAKKEESLMDVNQILYGEDYVRDTIIVVEGVFDVWKIGPGACALFGNSFTDAQVYRIRKYPKRIICLDRDAQYRAGNLCDLLSVFPGETMNVVLETGKDACEASPKELSQLRSMLK